MSHKPLSVGPWGGNGGTQWDDGAYSGVRQIIVVHADAIDSIKIEYDRDGTAVWSDRHGGNGGRNTDKIQLDYPKEILTSMSGHYGPISQGSPSVIRSLTFESNFKKYGPYGVQQGAYFSFPMNGGKIIGFHGQSGWYLDSIGVYLSHLHPLIDDMSPDLSIVPATSMLTPSDSMRSLDANQNKTYNILFALGDSTDNVKLHCSRLGSMSPESFNSATPSFNDRGFQKSLSSKLLPIYSSVEKNSAVGSPVVYGPWGGNGGSVFDDGIYTGVRQIVLTRGAGIASIKVEYDRNGHSIWGNRHGGNSTGIKTDKVVFDYPFEILTHITGYFGTVLLMGPTVIKSLTFHTTRGKHGPYGEEQGTFFNSKLAEGMIVGFHGRKGWAVDAIGVHVLEGQVADRLYPAGKPFILDDFDNLSSPSSNGETDGSQWSNKMIPVGGPRFEQVLHGVVRESVPLGPGPWGGDGGKPWDDGVFSGIRQIIIFREEVINSIQVEYDRNGQSVWSTRHGGSGGETTNRIKFDYPNEVLTCVSGYYSCFRQEGDPKVIKSLTFYSSRGKYGPFGEEFGKFFTSAQTGGKIVGFHGKSGLYLDAIGVHMQHWLGNEQKSTKNKISRFFSSTKPNGNK
ncbi:jacalin-related lectin 3 isoform X1 [Cryptomeria japonica]|uniref:jacalin-related lectin 3 isoform X1 n=1 Tax=Cryptomeria japonica TaxID=3369 RepID=UPI0027DA6DF5|nr:jacalin-related lectin 3 isoform X1 [Cryptomeria japonica]